MSPLLALAWCRDLARPLTAGGFALGLAVAAVLAFQPVLGPEDPAGAFLAHVQLLAGVLVLLCGRVLAARRRAGMDLEERLRDPRGRRAPLAAFLGASLALAGLLAAAAGVALAFGPHRPPPPARFPVAVHGLDGGGWGFDFGGRVPASADLLLTLAWDEAPPEAGAAFVADPGGTRVVARPGELLRVPVGPAAAAAGRLELRPAEGGSFGGSRPELLRTLARLQVARADAFGLAVALGRLFLFLAPLLAMLLALERRGDVDGPLAALAVLALAGLLAADPGPAPMAVPRGPGGLLVRAVLGLRAVLPDVGGLAAAGRDAALRAGTTPIGSVLAWWALGVLALWLAARPRRRVALGGGTE